MQQRQKDRDGAVVVLLANKQLAVTIMHQAYIDILLCSQSFCYVLLLLHN